MNTEPSVTARLANAVLAIHYDQLPAQAIDMCKQVTLDGLAVMIAGSREPTGVGRICTAYVRDMGGAPQASVVTGGFKTSIVNAAYVNGTLAHALDFDDIWFPLNHPTAPTLPAILAIAEYHGLSGKRIIEGIVAAFEVQARLRMAALGLEAGVGFHKPGTTGTFGAAAAAARLLNLDTTRTLMALGLAGSRACSLSINTGSMTQSSHAGNAASMGVECGVLASMGWTASADVFGPKGFFDAFMPGNSNPELLYKDFGKPWRMVDPGVGFKKHPAHIVTHRSIDAALALRAEHKIAPAQIARIEITYAPFDLVNRPQPKTGLDGKFSLQYTTLLALLDGEISSASFTAERRFAADVVAMLPNTQLIPDKTITPDFDKMHNIVTVHLNDGRVVAKRVDILTGWVGYPLPREQRLNKFFSCARNIIADKDADRLLELVEKLETLSDIRELMDIARGTGTA